jgi:PAS domain-containing protein
LADLTGLSPEFLSRRPSLIAMLDGMRDRNMIPEPKDWKGWRHQLADMERAAASGQFEDTWALPGGQTYRITGRRHLNGGLALMIDDISTEIIRSRRYRADLELCQRVVDTLEEGIAVFASTGQLVMSNTAYAALWGHDPGEQLAPMGFARMAAQWRALSAPSTLWTEAEEFSARLDDRAPWQAEARLLDGRLIACRFVPLSDGATLVGFCPVLAESAPRALTATRVGA